MKHSSLTCVLALLLAGCVKLLPDAAPAPLRVDLTPLAYPASTAQTKAGAIKIYLPTCSETLDSFRIGISSRDNAITIFDYLADVEWKDRLPMLVQNRITQLVERSGYFQAVGTQNEKFNAAYLLQTYIHRFEISQQDNITYACIEVVGTLIRRYDHTVLQQKAFNIQVPLTRGASLNAFLKALDAAFKQFQAAYIEWIKMSINPL
jgi:ABC-type uncharacterized transport system auxiliary subunit